MTAPATLTPADKAKATTIAQGSLLGAVIAELPDGTFLAHLNGAPPVPFLTLEALRSWLRRLEGSDA